MTPTAHPPTNPPPGTAASTAGEVPHLRLGHRGDVHIVRFVPKGDDTPRIGLQEDGERFGRLPASPVSPNCSRRDSPIAASSSRRRYTDPRERGRATRPA